MITFQQFKNEYRRKEALEGNKQVVSDGLIVSREVLTETELREMYNSLEHASKTGLEHHGDIIGGDNVLTLKSLGR